MRLTARVGITILIWGLCMPLYAEISKAGIGAFEGVKPVDFSEVPVGTVIPFEIDELTFSGKSGSTINGQQFAPSGRPFLSSSSPMDKISIDFSRPMQAFGFYFRHGSAYLPVEIRVDFYEEDTLSFSMRPETSEGFFGAVSDSPTLTRAVIQNTENDTVSFLIDDIVYIVPEPAYLCRYGCLALISLGGYSRRRCMA